MQTDTAYVRSWGAAGGELGLWDAQGDMGGIAVGRGPTDPGCVATGAGNPPPMRAPPLSPPPASSLLLDDGTSTSMREPFFFFETTPPVIQGCDGWTSWTSEPDQTLHYECRTTTRAGDVVSGDFNALHCQPGTFQFAPDAGVTCARDVVLPGCGAGGSASWDPTNPKRLTYNCATSNVAGGFVAGSLDTSSNAVCSSPYFDPVAGSARCS